MGQVWSEHALGTKVAPTTGGKAAAIVDRVRRRIAQRRCLRCHAPGSAHDVLVLADGRVVVTGGRPGSPELHSYDPGERRGWTDP